MKKFILAGVGLVFLMGCAHHRHHKDGEGGDHMCSMHEHKNGEKCPMCDKHKGKDGMMCSMDMSKMAARADVRGLGKSKVSGQIQLSPESTGLKVEVKLKGLKANQTHGFHIHEFGDCSAADGSSAGGHYNPGEKNHGAPTDEIHHAGDLGNVVADAKGEVATSIVVPGVMFKEVMGRSFVVHAKADDLKSQPAGNAGDRIACGVIGASKP